MNQIDELIAEYCPNGVEFKPFSEMGTFTRGGGPQKKDFVSAGTGCIHYGQIYTFYGISAEETNVYVDEVVAGKSRQAKPQDVVIAVTGENDEDLGRAVAWIGEDSVAVSNHTLIFSTELNAKYVSYFLRSTGFHRQKKRFITGTKVRALPESAFSKILIPVPPLEVQRAIVEILDKFTALEAELEAELEARKKQYDFYMGVLMEPNITDRKVKLGDVATIVRGASPRPIRSFLTDDEFGIPWIKIGDVPENGKYVSHTAQRITAEGSKKSRIVEPGDFILSNSMSFGRPYISKISGCIHDGWLSISKFEDVFIPDYLYYLLRSRPVQLEFERRAGSGTVKNLNADIVKSVVVPAPAIEEQRKIVKLLDKFDALVNDLSSGLPAEIMARRKQYEYYRDQLLTFKELAS